MTLREAHTNAKQELINNAEYLGVPADSIVPGKYGEIPNSTPGIWIFTEPHAQSQLDRGTFIRGTGKIECWCMTGGKSVDENCMDANELAERVLFKLHRLPSMDNQENPIQVIATYDDIAICSVTLEFKYQSSTDRHNG